MSEHRPAAARRTSSSGRRKLEAFYDLGFLRRTRERSRSRPPSRHDLTPRDEKGEDIYGFPGNEPSTAQKPNHLHPTEEASSLTHPSNIPTPASFIAASRNPVPQRPALRSAISHGNRGKPDVPARIASAHQVHFGQSQPISVSSDIDLSTGGEKPRSAARPPLSSRPSTSGSQRSVGSERAPAARPPPQSSCPPENRPLYDRAYHDKYDQTSFNWRAGASVGLMDLERSRTRRERTFVGAECAVCEEPLEHTLRGERILQFSCGHVSHEACFYEFLRESESQFCPTCNAPLGLDTTRGGNVLDLEKLSDIVRSAAQTSSYVDRGRPALEDYERERGERPQSRESHGQSQQRHSKESRERIQRFGPNPSLKGRVHQDVPPPVQQNAYPSAQHGRNDSGTTGLASSADFPAESEPIATGHRHEFDVRSRATSTSSSRGSMIKNPIPAPIVTVRSEFPTLNRSRLQQTLTCLVTVEVPSGKWRPDPEDLRNGPPAINPAHAGEAPQPSRPVTPVKSAAVTAAAGGTTGATAGVSSTESPEALEEVTEDLRARVENWHGLDFQRFGNLRLHGTIRVGKDRQSWQELECYLFAEMLICVKEKKGSAPVMWEEAGEKASKRKTTRCTLKGSILIKKHLKQVSEATNDSDPPVLTLSLSVAELPSFHLQFTNRNQLELWRRALLELHDGEAPSTTRGPSFEATDNSETDEEDYRLKTTKRVPSVNSSWPSKSQTTAPTEYASSAKDTPLPRLSPPSIHVPLDLVVVIPISSSMQGLKISLLRDALKFLVQSLGDRDRMGLVTFGSGGGGVPLVGMTNKAWAGWSNVLSSIRPVGQKSLRADVVDGANVAMDLLMQRKSCNPIGTILLISDSSTLEAESVDFVVSRAEAAKITIHSFGLGLTHKPDTMIELSTRTKASYTYVKDWMMLRDCVAGCLGSLQSLSHQNARLRLKLPEGSPAKFVKISGALQSTRRAAGKDAEAILGDLRFGDKRDILVQLVIAPDPSTPQELPQDPWETIVSGLEALGGPWEPDEGRPLSVEEVPLIQADVNYGDVLRQGTITYTRPSLLAITMLPATSKMRHSARNLSPPIPPHPSIVQRRMELLTSDMLTKALTLVSRGHHDRAQSLLIETRTILKGLGKGGLPPLPPTPAKTALAALGGISASTSTTSGETKADYASEHANTDGGRTSRTPSPAYVDVNTAMAAGIDPITVQALDAELESSLEWIGHPAVFGRDSRKAVLQAIGVIASQRGYTFRSPVEALWAGRVPSIKRLTTRSREWREADESLMEEV